MDEKLTKSGTFQIGYNKKTKECATYCWSEDVRLGKKIVLGNGYIKKKREADDVIVPLFDHYNIAFSGCDCFNWTLHNKLWPLKQRGQRRIASDYFFTCILINCYHLWIDAGPASENCSNVSWCEFCVSLSHEIVSKF